MLALVDPSQAWLEKKDSPSRLQEEGQKEEGQTQLKHHE